ncbi:MAG: restriction endonuclease subunit S [Limisphaerales bacterium]
MAAVPSHWEVRSLRTLIRPRNERNRADLPLLSVAREKGVFVRSLTDENENHNVIPEDLSNYKIARAGNLVINKMKAWQGSMGIAPCDGIVSPAYFVFDFSIANRAFGQALLRSKPYVAHFGQASDGVRVGQWDLTIAGMRQIPVLVAPPEEQAAMVRFLDYANGRLERAIRAKRKVIALLHEQKQAIIHRAVTRGLDPTVPLKPSGSRWFPELPEKWEALTLRRVITAAIDRPHFSPQYYDSGIPFLSARNVKADRWSLDNAKFISEADYKEFCRRVRPEIGDVLFTKGGTTGVARAVDLKFPFQVWVHIAVLKLNRQRITPEFLAFCLNSPRCYEQSQLFTRGATNQDLGLGRLKEIELPVPPTLEEQRKIVEALETRLSEFATATNRLEQEIELLREYRTRLVADVVTGKLDVRPAARQLPEEEAEPEVAVPPEESDREPDAAGAEE